MKLQPFHPSRLLWISLSLMFILVLNTLSGNTFRYLSTGMPAPDFSLSNFAGGRVTLKESLNQKAIVIVFWASWSKRSLEELQDLEKFKHEWKNTEFHVVAINVEGQVLSGERRDSLRALVASLGIQHNFLWDDGLAIFNLYGVISVPSTLVLDKSGIIRVALNGYSQGGRSVLEDSLKEFLGLQTAPSAKSIITAGYQPVEKARLHYHLGVKLMRLRKYPQAEAQFKQACGLDSGFVQPWLSLGEVLTKIGSRAEAVSTFEKALRLDGHNAAALWHLGLLACLSGDTTKALSYLEQSLQEDENLYQARLERAQINLGLGQLGLAAKDLELVQETNPTQARLLALQASLIRHQGDLKTATAMLRSAVEQFLQP